MKCSTISEKYAKNMIKRGKMGRKLNQKKQQILFYMMAGSCFKRKYITSLNKGLIAKV